MPREEHRWSPICSPPVGLVRPVRRQPHDASGPTRAETRGKAWRQSSWGYYVPAEVDGSLPEQRILEQSVRAPAGGAVTGWAGCRVWGARFFDGVRPDGATLMPVPIVTGGPALRGDERIVVLRDRIGPEEIVVRYGIPCARPLRALFDAMRGNDLRGAVVDMDMMAAAELVSISRMARYAAEHPGWTGLPVVLAALPLASEHSRSPNETRTRLIWMLDAGLPPPLVNQSIFDRSGRLLGIADLLDVEAGVVGEFDGADHRRARRQTKDAGREDRFREHGLEVFHVTGLDLGHTDRVVHRMHSARARALWQPEVERRWTTEAPRSWEEPPSLDEILQHKEVMREFHLQVEREARM